MHLGDRPERDLKGAKAAGMKTCLADYRLYSSTAQGIHKTGLQDKEDKRTIYNCEELEEKRLSLYMTGFIYLSNY